MAFISYVSPEQIPLRDRVADEDNILRIHGLHSRVMKLHFQLYVELMHGLGPLPRSLREMIATAVSTVNECHY